MDDRPLRYRRIGTELENANPRINQTALITGASSGIGYELARIFAEHGYDLVLVSRNESALHIYAAELSKHHGISAKVIGKDLSLSSAPFEISDQLKRENIFVDILVNNAGAGIYGPFLKTDLSLEIRILELNIVALTALTKLFLDEMIKKKKGKILNVASTAAFLPGPLMAVYYASKAYVLSFSEALSRELKGSGVTVTALCPGPTQTAFQKNAGLSGVRLLKKSVMIDAGSVARDGFEGLMKGKTIVVSGFLNKILVFSVRFLPRDFITAIALFLQKKLS